MTSIFGQVDSLANAMSYHRERQGVLAGNVTNIETPGYRPLDVFRQIAPAGGQLAVASPGHMSTGAELEVSSPGHITSSGEAGGLGGPSGNYLAYDDGGNQAGPDGNAVALEHELAKMDANRVRYNTSAELVTRRLAMLRYAAGDGVG